ncbi:MAG: diguanylate cyclase domain-containing protein [Bacillota bacterium]
MKDNIKKFYLWGVILLIFISLSFYVQYLNNNNLLLNNVERMSEMSVDVLNERIYKWLDTKGQLIKDAKNYIEIRSHTDKEILKYLEVLLDENEEFFSIYYGTKNNTMINASGWEMPEGFDLRKRPWYKKAVKQDKLIYTDAFINASEDDIIITIAMPVYNNTNNELLGVIAGDVSISTIISYVEDQNVVEKGFFMLTDQDNHILAYPGLDYNLKNGLPTIKEKFDENFKMNQFEIDEVKKIKLDDKQGFFSYNRVKNTQWLLANFTSLEYYTESFNQLLKTFLFAFILSLLVILSFFWLENKHVIKPLKQFNKNIKNIDLVENLDYRLPLSDDNNFTFLNESINNVLQKTQMYFEKLKSSEEKFKSYIKNAPYGVFIANEKGDYIEVNKSACEITEYSEKELLNLSITELVQDEYTKKAINHFKKVDKNGFANDEIGFITKSGKKRFWNINAVKLSETRFLGFVKDVTKRKVAQNELKESENRLDTLITNIPAVIYSYIVSNGENGLIFNTTYINNNIKNVLGFKPDELVGNEDFHHSLFHPKDKEILFKKIKKLIQGETDSISLSFRFKDKSGNFHWLRDSQKVIFRKDNETKIVGVWWDITKRKQAEEKIRYKTFHDELTGLYNRAYFNEEIKRYDNKRQLPLSIIMGDVNGLKIANDTFGHKEGDKLLQKIAQIIKNACRKEDLVARIGGDEFIVLLPKTSKEEAENIHERIKNNCKKANKDPIKPSIALGCATKTNMNEDINIVLKKAEDKMYKNKVHESASVHNTILDSLITILRETTNETLEHSERLKKLAVDLGKKLDLSKHQLDVLSSLAALHDLGKIAISKDILQKPGSLTNDEWEEVKRHPEAGYKIANSSPKLSEIAQGILCHHERFDGNGYPQGLKGKKIPLMSRIITIIDSYDVMTNSRPYKEPISKKEALDELKRCSGSQFDPDLVELFIEIIKNE